MSTSMDKIHQALADLRTSWYFRIWFGTFTILALTGFIGMIIIAQRSTTVDHSVSQQSREAYLLRWEEKQDKIPYPSWSFDFHRLDGVSTPLTTIDKINCSVGYNGATPVDSKLAADKLSARVTPTTNAVSQFFHGIFCDVTVTSNNFVRPSLHIQFDDEQGHGTWIPAAPQASLVLHKEHNVDNNSFNWHVSPTVELVLEPQNSTVTTRVGVYIPGQTVTFMQTQKKEDDLSSSFGIKLSGMTRAGEIGGFWCFLWMIHWFVMNIVIGSWLSNTSEFLANHDQ